MPCRRLPSPSQSLQTHCPNLRPEVSREVHKCCRIVSTPSPPVSGLIDRSPASPPRSVEERTAQNQFQILPAPQTEALPAIDQPPKRRPSQVSSTIPSTVASSSYSFITHQFLPFHHHHGHFHNPQHGLSAQNHLHEKAEPPNWDEQETSQKLQALYSSTSSLPNK